MQLAIKVPAPYDFASSVRDHGWIALAPFRWLDGPKSVQRVERLSSGKIVLLTISAQRGKQSVSLNIEVQPEQITKHEQQEILDHTRWMLRLDEDLSAFYLRCESFGELQKMKTGRGRLLRSPGLFEDCIKTICTTNTTWSQTKGMVARLVARLGEPFPANPDLRAFPTAEQIATAGEKIFEADIRLGYRNAYVLQLAREVAGGQRDLEALKTSSLPYTALKKELKSIKGVGDYAAHTLLMLLGRYDEVAVDSEMRAHVRRTRPDGHTFSDREMAALYERWGEWRFLAYWFELVDSPVT